jgi:outer membrane protein OmpA-like peptidoglycan-associated protein
MSKWSYALMVAGVAAVFPSCASRGFVRTRVGEVNGKVANLTQAVEETQERTKRAEGAIADVEQKTKAAQGTADGAQAAAKTAGEDARAAGAKASDAGVKADVLDKASKRVVYTVTLSDEEGQFKFGKSDVPDEVKAKIDELVNHLKADPNGAYLEIEGHTDSVGATGVNDRIGLERAEAVKRYISEQHQIPLHKMSVVSYGKTKPVASNRTSVGRAQNRRIVIRVLI